MAGRPPLPAKVKHARGNAGKREIKENIAPVAAGPQPPAWVAADPLALAQWNALAPEMIARQMLTVFDVNRFGRYCTFMGVFLANLENLRRCGLVQVGKNGPAKSAIATILLDIDRELRGLEDPFGFNPLVRAKLYAPESAASSATALQEGKFFAPPATPEDPENEE